MTLRCCMFQPDQISQLRSCVGIKPFMCVVHSGRVSTLLELPRNKSPEELMFWRHLHRCSARMTTEAALKRRLQSTYQNGHEGIPLRAGQGCWAARPLTPEGCLTQFCSGARLYKDVLARAYICPFETLPQNLAPKVPEISAPKKHRPVFAGGATVASSAF